MGTLEPGSEPGPPATGDWVALDIGSDGRALIAGIVPRRSAIKRLDPSAASARPEEQVLVANLDLVFIVHALDRPTHLPRLERTLVVAWDSGAVPVLVLTKADLVEGGASGPAVAGTVKEIREIAREVDVIAVSNVTGFGLDRVLALVANGTTVALIGESGSGKSTLINSFLSEEIQITGPTRESDGKGRHTTTSRELVVIPGRGVIIDTPGLRSIGLWSGRDGLAQAFPDIHRLASECRFGDCGHQTEPGCAIRTALDDGDLDSRRINSYRKMEREVEHQERQRNIRKRRAEEKADGRRYRKAKKSTVEW
jgi:ribosome biogenesis GTPase